MITVNLPFKQTCTLVREWNLIHSLGLGHGGFSGDAKGWRAGNWLIFILAQGDKSIVFFGDGNETEPANELAFKTWNKLKSLLDEVNGILEPIIVDWHPSDFHHWLKHDFLKPRNIPFGEPRLLVDGKEHYIYETEPNPFTLIIDLQVEHLASKQLKISPTHASSENLIAAISEIKLWRGALESAIAKKRWREEQSVIPINLLSTAGNYGPGQYVVNPSIARAILEANIAIQQLKQVWEESASPTTADKQKSEDKNRPIKVKLDTLQVSTSVPNLNVKTEPDAVVANRRLSEISKQIERLSSIIERNYSFTHDPWFGPGGSSGKFIDPFATYDIVGSAEEEETAEAAIHSIPIGGLYGSDRNMTVDDVQSVVDACRLFKDKGGTVTAFYRGWNFNSGHFALDTLRGWLKDPRFKPKKT